MTTGPRTPRQTQSYLQRVFAERAIRLRPKLGQNFLIDLNLHRVLVEAAELQPADLVLEVGAGTGALTAELAQRAGEVVAVEVDPRLYQLAEQALHQFRNITLLQADILKDKNHINPEVLGRLRERLGQAQSAAVVHRVARRATERLGSLKLVANLPYAVATPVISNLLAADLPLVSMTVTVQHEVAERLTARPSSKDYGALSVWVQALADVRVLRRLPPEVFWPRPEIHSAMVQITLKAGEHSSVLDRAFFHELVRRMFLHRRKTLSKTLAAELKDRLTRQQAEKLLAAQGLSADVRAEELPVPQWIALANAVVQKTAER